MSAQQSLPTASPPAGTGDGNGGLDFPGDGPHQPVEVGEPSLPLATADLAHLLANGQWGDGAHGSSVDSADAHAYDGHVALALDTGALPDIDSTLDLLTSSHHLFDVPALDVSSGPDDASSA
jgi:hypothetical protein